MLFNLSKFREGIWMFLHVAAAKFRVLICLNLFFLVGYFCLFNIYRIRVPFSMLHVTMLMLAENYVPGVRISSSSFFFKLNFLLLKRSSEKKSNLHVTLYYHDGYLLLFDVDVVYKFRCYQENNNFARTWKRFGCSLLCYVTWGGFLIVYKRASIVIRCSKGINGSGNWFAALKLVLLCMVGKLVLGLIWIYVLLDYKRNWNTWHFVIRNRKVKLKPVDVVLSKPNTSCSSILFVYLTFQKRLVVCYRKPWYE